MLPGVCSNQSIQSEEQTLFPVTPPSISHFQLNNQPEGFSFAAAGWLKLYHFGVASFLQSAGLDKKAKFVGSSAGSLAAAGLVLNIDFRSVRDFSLKCVEDTHGYLTPAFRLHKMVESCLELMLDEKAFTRLNNRLEVSVTVLPFCTNRRYKEFSSSDDFHQALLASCRMSPFAGMPFKYRGEYIFDGGLSDFQPTLDNKTITISPFFFADADIKPSRYVPPWWALYPPRVEDFAWLFDLGYYDAMMWAKKNAKKHSITEASEIASLNQQYNGKEHDFSFGRFWGYRSIARIIPSWLMTVLLGSFFFVFIRPMSMMSIFSELIVTGIYYFCKTFVFFWSREKSKKAWDRFKTASGQIINPNLFLRGLLPGLSPCLPLNKEALLKSSLMFRMFYHFL